MYGRQAWVGVSWACVLWAWLATDVSAAPASKNKGNSTIEALQEDKQELRLQLQDCKKKLQYLQKGPTDILPPTDSAKPTDTTEDVKKGVKIDDLCPCRENLTEAQLEERNFVGLDCVCENVTILPKTTPAPVLLGTGSRVKDCAGHQTEGATESGMYEIYPSECRAVRVWCDLETDGGNDVLHQLTAKDSHVLRVDAEDFNGGRRWGVWGRFRVEDEEHKYKLLAVMYSSNSTLGDGLLWHSGMHFSTVDRDNDKHKGSCAHEYKGGWWYNVCHNANPTGILTNSDDFDSVGWVYWNPRQYKWASLRYLQMKIRPQNFGSPNPSNRPGDCNGD
ncbi:Techylectin-5B-like 6 [Homarus americanus]|uniref:Techylectin-5B-like 6 n=1 Tax=Homarus americanus TaxID=6706 RepID=A0A8J5MWA6_HOMAM|nr:Techylectin-5B-like 6 [Homarus americanus]